MNKYSVYPNIYKFLTDLYEANLNKDNILMPIKKMVTCILTNHVLLKLTAGQIKLVFCFIDKLRAVICDNCDKNNNKNKIIGVIIGELLCDYSGSQLLILNTLKLDANDNQGMNIPADNNISLWTQEKHNEILINACRSIESGCTEETIHDLVNTWFTNF